MQMIDPIVYEELMDIAKEKGISVQELLRAIVIPEWLKRRRAEDIESKHRDSEPVLPTSPGL